MDFNEILNFGDVITDTAFVTKANELNSWLIKIKKHIQLAADYRKQFKSLNCEDNINLKIFNLYALNSLCWVELRLKGMDPNTHQVKEQLGRVKNLMARRDLIIARRSRPALNKEAAKRFIRSGLWDPKSSDSGPLNKKIKFDED